MKKLFSLASFVLMLLMCMVLSPAAYADVIIEPVEPEDEFYTEHKDDCDLHGRNYIMKASDGAEVLWKSPVSTHKIATIENGNQLYIKYTYDDGNILWGYTKIYLPGDEDSTARKSLSGWLHMDNLEPVYDAIVFSEEHQDEFYKYADNPIPAREGFELAMWDYPGGKAYSTITLHSDMTINHAYKDENGVEWGYISYYYAIRNFWVCLDDLSSNRPHSKPQEDTSASVSPAASSSPKVIVEEAPGSDTLLIIILLVVVLVAGTAVLIRVLYKKK